MAMRKPKVVKAGRPKLESAKISALLRGRMPELRRRYKVKYLGLFGSFVRNTQTERSDIDILVEFDTLDLSLLKFIELENHLSDLLKKKVDLVEKAGLKPVIGERILSEVKSL